MLRDFRHSLRLLWRAPGFTTVAVFVLALGIGANTAVFSVVNALALQPRPGRIDTLYGVFSRDRVKVDDFRDLSYPAYLDLRGRRDVFDSLMAHTFTTVGVREGDVTRRSFATLVSSNYFETLGVPLAAGRTFTADEEQPGSDIAVVITSYSAWRKAGLSPAFIGSTMRINAREFTIVGVAPKGFSGTLTIMSPELWLPLGTYDTVVNDMFKQRVTGLMDRGNHPMNIAGALRPGVTVASAEATLEEFGKRLGALYPRTDDQLFKLAPLPRMTVSSEPRTDTQVNVIGTLLASMAALVLVVACLNLANLMLARGAARRREIAIRQALGSGRRRIVQQLLVEGLTVSAIGAAFGALLGWWTTGALTAWFSGAIPLGIEIVVEPSYRLVIAAGGFALLSTLFFALGPAWSLSSLSHSPLTLDLKNEPGRITRRFGVGSLLVAGQLAVSLALVAAGGLFVRAAINAAVANPGFALDHQLVVNVDASVAGYDETRTRSLLRAVLQRLRGTPGVVDASMASMVPFGELREGRRVRLTPDTGIDADFVVVSSGYFNTLGLRVRRGREFTVTDDEPGAGVKPAVIDVQLARRLFGDAEALGRQVLIEPRTGEALETFTVIGVAPPLRHDLFDAEPRPTVYVSYGSKFYANMTLHVRTDPAAPDAAMLATVRGELQRLDSRLPVFTARTMAMQRDKSLTAWSVRVAAVMFSTFGALALLLATIGAYGLKAYEVSRRTREIGIRMALGATAGDVQRLVLREGMRTTIVALALGLLLAAGTGKLVSSLLYRVSPFDPMVLIVAAAVLASAAMLACIIPARRATRIVPLEALRSE
jgi:predicted permease